LLNAITNFAERAASTISQPSARVAPASRHAVPRDDRLRQRRQTAHQRVEKRSTDRPRSGGGPLGSTLRSFKSWPAQKPRPAPVISRQRTLVALGLLQTFRQLLMHQVVKTVETVRAIEGNGHHDALFHCAENESFHD
jgi:hypothetical protein